MFLMCDNTTSVESCFVNTQKVRKKTGTEKKEAKTTQQEL